MLNRLLIEFGRWALTAFATLAVWLCLLEARILFR